MKYHVGIPECVGVRVIAHTYGTKQFGSNDRINVGCVCTHVMHVNLHVITATRAGQGEVARTSFSFSLAHRSLSFTSYIPQSPHPHEQELNPERPRHLSRTSGGRRMPTSTARWPARWVVAGVRAGRGALVVSTGWIPFLPWLLGVAVRESSVVFPAVRGRSRGALWLKRRRRTRARLLMGFELPARQSIYVLPPRYSPTPTPGTAGAGRRVSLVGLDLHGLPGDEGGFQGGVWLKRRRRPRARLLLGFELHRAPVHLRASVALLVNSCPGNGGGRPAGVPGGARPQRWT